MQGPGLEVKSVKVLKYLFCTVGILFLASCATFKEVPLVAEIPLKIEEVKIDPESFNPTVGEKVNIYYNLSKDAKVTIRIFDPDWGLVTNLLSNEPRKKGLNCEVWDGRDLEKTIVPDQAYFFTIEAEDESKGRVVYDPTTFSGGQEIDLVDVVYDREAGTISFNLPFSAWVLARLGIKNGALMKTLLDWEPRPKGENIVFWNGKDESGIVDLYSHPKFSMMFTTMSFPENSIITIGNNSKSYYEYKKQVVKKRPRKPERPVSVEKRNFKLSRHYDLPRWKDRAPRFSVSFPQITETTPSGLPVIRGKTLLKVALDEQDKEFIIGQRFEIVLYVDDILYAEEEEGYSPFSWMWDVSEIPEGEHILTINIVSLNDQVGAQSLKFMVMNTQD